VQYQSWRGASRRELEPLGLVLKGGAWYLIARAAGKPGALTFRLANIHELNASRRRFKRPARFDLATHWRDAMSRYETDLNRLTAHIAVSPRGETWLANARIKIAPVSQDAGSAEVPPGWKECLMPIESIEHGARKLLGYGAHVKILGPRALKDQFIAELSQLKALYQSGDD
jgi:predicted DNA-binding transcriptional regulator YafY